MSLGMDAVVKPNMAPWVDSGIGQQRGGVTLGEPDAPGLEVTLGGVEVAHLQRHREQVRTVAGHVEGQRRPLVEGLGQLDHEVGPDGHEGAARHRQRHVGLVQQRAVQRADVQVARPWPGRARPGSRATTW